MSTSKVIKDGGYKATSDPYKYQNGDSTVTLRPGNGIIVDNNGRQNKYGIDTSDSFLAGRLAKK